MYLTIRQIINEIKLFSTARVVAGENGLDNQVTWTHIREHENFYEWIRDGTLLISSGFILKNVPDMFANQIPLFIEKGLTGLFISIGSHIKTIPPNVIHQANRYNFPIITFPATIPLMEVTHEIHEKIISTNYAMIEQSLNIHKILNKIVVNGGGLSELARKMVELIKRSITIEDPSLNLLAYADYRTSDDSRNRTIQEGRTPSKVVAYLEKTGILRSFTTDPAPRKVPIIPEIGFSHERIVAPIMVGEQLYGYFWIISGNEPIKEMDYIIIERGATIAALILSREEAIHRAEQAIIRELFENEVDPFSIKNIVDVAKGLSKLGVDSCYQLMIVEHKLSEFMLINRLFMIIKDQLGNYLSFIRIFEKGNRFIVLLKGDDIYDNESLAKQIVNDVNSKGYNVICGLSNHSLQTSNLNKHYQEANEAIRICKALYEKDFTVWTYEKLGSLSYSLGIPNDLRSQNYYYALIETMVGHDTVHGTGFVHTLEVFLDNKTNTHESARKLFIHRNTLLQRLQRMKDKWKIDLDDTYSLLNLHQAIKDWRIQNNFK